MRSRPGVNGVGCWPPPGIMLIEIRDGDDRAVLVNKTIKTVEKNSSTEPSVAVVLFAMLARHALIVSLMIPLSFLQLQGWLPPG